MTTVLSHKPIQNNTPKLVYSKDIFLYQILHKVERTSCEKAILGCAQGNYNIPQ